MNDWYYILFKYLIYFTNEATDTRDLLCGGKLLIANLIYFLVLGLLIFSIFLSQFGNLWLSRGLSTLFKLSNLLAQSDYF